MLDYRLSPLAENDLEEIWLYTFEQWSVKQADSYYNEILAIIERLASGDLKGRHTNIRRGYLKYPAGKHLVFFRQSGDKIEVVRILHQSMDFERHLG